METQKKMICQKCLVELEEQDTEFSYLGNVFKTSMPKCPTCGQVFIPESIVKGRMSEVEAVLESK